MKKKDLLRIGDPEFNTFVLNLIYQTTANAALWNILISIIAGISTPYVDAWTAAYAITSDPTKATQVAISTKTAARKALIKALRPFLKTNIYGNTSMTEADRLACKCPPYSTNRTPYGTPTGTPLGTVNGSTSGHKVDFNFLNGDGASGRPTRSRPLGTALLMFRYFIGTTAPTKPEQCPFIVFSPTTPLTIELTADDAGKYLFGFYCWLGTNGQPGDFNKDPIKVLIP